MEWKSKVMLFLCLLAVALSTVACEEGGAEKAGKEIDDAFNTVKQKINKATE